MADPVPAQLAHVDHPLDTTELDVNDSLHVSDVVPPEKVEVVYAINFTLAVCTPPEKEPVAEVDDDLEAGAMESRVLGLEN